MNLENLDINKEENLVPFGYYRKLRPENFSDTTITYEVPLTQELLDLQLNLLSTKKLQSSFEEFIIAIAKRVITPNIKPQTGPDGGGDGKVDAETYEVSNDISDKWYSLEDTARGKEYWAFAISCKKEWKTKIKSDIEKIIATQRGYTKILFFSNQYIKSSSRTKVEDKLSIDYNINVKIYDANDISKWVFQHKCIDIALSTLGFSDTYKKKSINIGPNDKRRKEELDKIEQNILRHVEGLDTQYIEELREAYILSRGLELPRTDIEGRFQRAIRECKIHGSQQQMFNIVYDYAWTSFFWFEDIKATYNHYNTLKNLIETHCNVVRVEKLTNILTCLINSTRVGLFDSNTLKFELEYIKTLKVKLDKDQDKQSSALYLAIYIQEQTITEHIYSGNSIDEDITLIKPLLIQSASHLEIDIESQYNIIKQLSNCIEENESFEQLINEFAEIIAEKRSKAEAAKVRLSRAEDHFLKKRWSDSIKQLGFCVYAFEQESCTTELIQSSGMMGIALSNLDLPYSAQAYLIKAASLLIQDFYRSGIIHQLLITTLHKLCEIELKLGRIIMYLNWFELLSVLSTNAQYNEDKLYKTYCIQEDTAWAYRFAFSNLQEASISKLPKILERMGMLNSFEFLKYVLGYYEEVDKDYLHTFEKISNNLQNIKQDINNNFYDKLNISTIGKAYVKTMVNNFTITVNYDNHSKVQRIAELLLASIESLMATVQIFEIIPINNTILIDTILTDKESNIVYNDVNNKYDFYLNLSTFNYEVFWKCFVNFLLHLLTTNAFTKESIETMLKNKQNGERLMDRVSVLQRTEMSLNNILGENYKYRIEDWSRENDKIYTFIGHNNIITEDSYSSKQSTLEIHSINSNMNLWNNAGWKGCSFIHDQWNQYPPTFGLTFLDIDKGRKIISEWESKYNVTIYIIKGINSNHPTWYRVCIAPTLTKENNTNRYCTTICRKHTMTPNTYENLSRFESDYQKHKECYIMAIQMKEDNSVIMPNTFNDAFKFNNIEIHEAYKIKTSDFAKIAIEKDDDPYIPDEYKHNAPVLEVLKEIKNTENKSNT